MIFVGLLDMLIGLLTAYRPQSVPVVVHLSLVKISMSQKSNSSQFMHIYEGNRSLIRKLFSTADVKICSVIFLSHTLTIAKMNNQNGLFKVCGKFLMHSCMFL